MEAERSRLETESDIPSNRRRRGFAQAVTSERDATIHTSLQVMITITID